MPMIYRRNRGLSPTREMADVTRGVKPMGLDTDTSLLGRTRRYWRGRGVLLASQRVYQTMWLAVLVYAFLGLPVLGRVLNFARFVHRFPAPKILQGLVVGMMQDVAIFLQASTCICLVKVLFDSDNFTPQGLVAANNARSFPNSGFLREKSNSARFLPVYMPVLANEYDLRDEGMEALASGVATNHRTLLSLGAAANRPALVARAMRAIHSLAILSLLQLILVAATIASVADFCLQVTMHPRLNRAFVNIFFNYMKQFTASLTDEEVMTRTVVGSWAVYFALVAALTYGFYTGRLPLASDFLRLPSALCCCFDRRYNVRKDSMNSSVTTTSGSYVSNLFASYWHRAGKPIRSRRRSSQGYSHLPGGGASGCASGYAAAIASGSSLCSTGYGSYTKSGPLTILGRCIVASLLMTAAALSASLLIDGKGGVDMKLMNNAMFTLQAEQFFYHPTKIHREEINCTTASSALRSTLGVSEQYELDKLGNDDHCALLWRKTTGYEGDNIFSLDLNVTSTAQPTKVQPNIIVINMESWRHLDVGALGGVAKKETTGKSATPQFDELAKTGVLYSKHYTQCVQTTRTLLTTLFGMLPSCTETTALKQYSTTLSVRGLPQFLKQRGYFNLFWSAVDLTWEYWDKFLLKNGFDKLVDDRKIRKMLHDTRNYKNTPDDHFSWGMHDHLSFEMLLYAIESAHNASVNSTDASAAAAKGRHYRAAHSTAKPPLPGWEGLQTPYFIDMYSITSHNPWALPNFYDVPDLSGLYTRYNKKYLDSMYFSDEMLGDFIAALRAKGLMKNTIVIIEGDHGYGRLEHDNNPSIADSGVWDEASRVPFLLLADDFLREQDKGTVVDQLSMQSDLMATIADILVVTPDEPLYQHGYGHSMKRRRVQPEAQKQAQALAAKTVKDKDAQVKDSEAEALAAEGRESPEERRVVLCNPFNGMSKGVRTEELKYIFHPDSSYNVFEPAIDPAEKKPLRTGFDVEEMDDATRDVFEYVTKAVDLNQFLFEANRFMTPLPISVSPVSAESKEKYNRIRRSHVQNVTTENHVVDEQVEPKQPRGPPAPVNMLD
ncbi:sulfatase-like protein [Phytophthora infestans T30-4]|uniref:Sulfatase-like protein n=1 Tax=Phytophthora infestans (strain T30-4) TaxID=403677 RepID=D0N3R3_PHYIT|nr:sulfatase-like protein [Phytophthora infestans T30-4]EEY69017.1 sulfatase-like protein [Phytophthora infestans T30-4]|eukprot:XP_002998871.1 sulfatase-like protein [Phytophthora infestans T30-4]